MRGVIVGYARSPFHRAHKGELADFRPEDLAGQVAVAVIERSGIDSAQVEDLMLGCAYPEGEQGLNIGRIATYMSGLPTSVPGATTNRLCGSSMQVIHDAAGAMAIGSGELFLCGGVESMSRIKRGGWQRSPHPGLEQSFPEAYIAMGLTAENLAASYDVSRDAQEEFALHSHQKAANARDSGRFDAEISPVSNLEHTVSNDGCIRGETSLESMAGLLPAFKDDGTVTAATSSPLTDGSAFTVVCTADYVAENSLNSLAAIESTAVAGVAPEIMGIGPVPATEKALLRAELTLDDIDVIELNEAFSSQSLACLQELGLEADDNRINIDGGAIAIGHPLGASGARITGKAATLLQRVGGDYALATMCIGGGMGIATILSRCD